MTTSHGLQKGMKSQLKGVSQNSFEEQLAKLMAKKDEKRPPLTVNEGIEDLIPNGEAIEGPMNKVKLWKGDADNDWKVYDLISMRSTAELARKQMQEDKTKAVETTAYRFLYIISDELREACSGCD
ncbi:hypothetical protein KXV81_002556 [Aspergillus fumigatus]|uniref:Uncharacterized protein n=3 Tax=Aspergillus fumigatus TaxID=746128 RepID=Q4X0E1_ASPFU|nr:hypothetical protein AFUA_2G13790 [Aspergillus fumigatus Af293]EDP54883.1 hypothetical protein AFUB_029420 [Aspergillus fumigatus A1163]KAF4269946.1 hypothetical protein CNMCM8714_006390 [Aspergillus fumigatus]KMK61654.1 hypothetical protein Y699_02495 [Aspergillus fumigatus Z5]EAL93674.1 hypothetical protein AFUA_2G13790 [Aspergillus fumigatus Af293]KAF4275727.1 hypothetical protein CNMCM8812_000258 [Aspergillus fumigatus]